MFGRIRRRRERRRRSEQRAEERRTQEQQKIQKEVAAAQDPQKIGEQLGEIQEQVSKVDVADEPQRAAKRGRFREEAFEDVTTEIPGLSEAQKQAMRESANAQINKQVQNYSRILASQAGRGGVRGGAAAAPQAELAQKGLDATAQFQRDLVEKDADVALKKLAAYMASLEGKTAEDVIRRQQYFDYITGKQDKARQDIYSQYFNKYLMRV